MEKQEIMARATKLARAILAATGAAYTVAYDATDAAYTVAYANAAAAKAPEEREWQTNHLRKML